MVRYVSALLLSLLLFPAAHAQTDTQPAATAGATTPEKKPVDPATDETKADEEQAGKQPSFFSQTTVTATGTKRDIFEVATPVTVIPEEKIRQKAPQNAADLLREEPGVDVAGVGPNQMRPVIRAQRGLRVLFLENGLRLNNARRQTDFGEISGLVNLDSVQKIEVVRGPASVLYGSDAIGGVLNLVSRDVAKGDPFRGSVDLTYGSAGDRKRGGANVSGSVGNFAYQVGASLGRSENYEAPAGSFGDIDLPEDTEVLDTGVDDSTLWGSLAWALNDRNALRFRLNRYDADQTGFGYIPGEEYGVNEEVKIRILYPEQQFDRYTLSWEGNSDQNPLANSTNVQVYYQRNKRGLNNDININIGPLAPNFPNSFVLAHTFNRTLLSTTGVRADAVKVFDGGRHTFTYGLEAYRDRSTNTDSSMTQTHLKFPFPPFEQIVTSTSNRANAPNATNTSSGVFVQDEMILMPKLRVTAGLRYSNVQTQATGTDQWNIEGLDFKDSNTVGALTATYQLTNELNALVSYGTAFRAPNIIERLFNGATPEGNGFQVLNPSLTSETSQNWDLGVKYRRADAFMELVGFQNTVDEGIVQDFLSAGEIAQLPADIQAAIKASGARFVVQQVNADRLRYKGVELALGYHMNSGLTVGGNYTYIDADRLGATTILPPDDVYSNKTVVYARFNPTASRWWVEYNIRHNGEAKANIDPDEPVPPVGTTLPSFTVHNLGGGVRLFENSAVSHEVTLWIENLTNELYAEFSNASFFRPQPGREFRAAYRLIF
jgi:hemoglobin/transferrin/lactoferrin receptor protein